MGRVGSGEWYAVYTRSHHEKKVARILGSGSFNVFFPTRRILSRRRDRRKLIEMPLLPNYLFVNTCSEQFDRIASTSGVAYILGYNGLPTPVPDEEVNSLRVLVHSGVEISPYPYLKEGDRVFIREGPFKGVVGVLLRTDPRSCRLIVSVHLMNRSVAVAVPTGYVEKFL